MKLAISESCLNIYFLASHKVTRFQLDSPVKMSQKGGGSSEGKVVVVKQERVDDEFVAPVRPLGGNLLRRVPCSIQKVPSISDLSDHESNNSLGKHPIYIYYVCSFLVLVWYKCQVIHVLIIIP